MIPNLDKEEPFSLSPYNTQILALLENYVRQQGYYLMMRCIRQCKRIIPIFSTWNVDGVVLLGAYKEEAQEIEERLKVPTVYIDTYAEGLEVANVGSDDYRGGFVAARYLLGKGHREIAFVGPKLGNPGVVQERFRGFCDACTERGVEITKEHIFTARTVYEDGVCAGKKIGLSNRKFTAVAAMADIVAFGVMEGLRLSGLNIPNDISVIGYDNLPECKYANPQLTTVSQNLEKKAFLAGEYLFKMIREKRKIVVNEKVDIEIVERQSVKEVMN
uniref:LacI family DNA-binding transcriptional regulator n=1 Tax=Acetatifactor sp. TaxID=1872090 RepID=UPI0040569FAA